MKNIFKELNLKNNVILAPMAGITDKYFRKIVRYFEPNSLIHTEMVHSIMLVMSKKDQEIVHINPEDHPISIQIFGHDPDYITQAALIAESKGFDAIDINMACPMKKIVKNGDGAALLLNRQLAETIIKRVVESVKIPVTIKIRAGWDLNNLVIPDFVKMAEYAGVSAVTLHARTRSQYYTGQANWEWIKIAKDSVNIPVIGNGDIWTPEDGARMLEQTKCDGIMLARGTLGKPWLIKQTVDYLSKGSYSQLEVSERMKIALMHLELMIEGKGEKRGIIECRKHLLWYTKGLKNSSHLRQVINSLMDKEELIKVLNNVS